MHTPLLDMHVALDWHGLEPGMHFQAGGHCCNAADAACYATVKDAFVDGRQIPIRLFHQGMGRSLPSYFEGEVLSYTETWEPHQVLFEIRVVTPIVTDPPD